ncbi:peptidylprolyl isomerase [Sphingosinicella sp. CPCC 101087]|uniref:peptidylprolyl isomerase n=1 Tax=Sphingosinicella sp. CPCC 101087 TaxID=2497754 RepID=UPI00101C7DCD|nr:peptidylprolyl isomerase [Sphingosinicella sp. CPCC 101087]
MIRTLACLALLASTLACGESPPAAAPEPRREADAASPTAPTADKVRVRLETEAGAIDLELDAKRAPITTANFLAYVDKGRFDGTRFYRASRTRGAEERGFIQGGIQRNYRLMLPAIAHEPTSQTGIRHEAGTISMARTAPGTAMGEFFITASEMPSMDAGAGREGDDLGFAAFGRVVGGLDVVRRILASDTVEEAGRGAMRGQMLANPVEIVRARRLD